MIPHSTEGPLWSRTLGAHALQAGTAPIKPRRLVSPSTVCMAILLGLCALVLVGEWVR